MSMVLSSAQIPVYSLLDLSRLRQNASVGVELLGVGCHET